MHFNILFFVCAVAFVSVTSAASVSAPHINKCKAEDSKCIKKSAQEVLPVFADGIPHLGVQSMNPMRIKTLDASTNNLKLITTNLVVYGLKNCTIKKATREPAKSKFTLKVQCPTLLEGDYEMRGNILVIPIEGKGKVSANITKMVVTIDGEQGETVKNGVKHWTINKWKSSFEFKERSTLDFTNLFNGNEALSRTASEVIRANANEVILDAGSGLVNGVVKQAIENIRNYFSNVPISELTLDV